jgi:hypothetical protein
MTDLVTNLLSSDNNNNQIDEKVPSLKVVVCIVWPPPLLVGPLR